MTEQSTGWRNGALNVALIAAVVVVAVLLYAFVRGPLLPAEEGASDAASQHASVDFIQVEVRNGAGVADLAAQTRNYLVEHDVDVVEVGDHTSFDVAHSRVVDRVGNLEAARHVAALMGISPEYVEQEIRPDYYLDASVIIGRDYASLKPFKQE